MISKVWTFPSFSAHLRGTSVLCSGRGPNLSKSPRNMRKYRAQLAVHMRNSTHHVRRAGSCCFPSCELLVFSTILPCSASLGATFCVRADTAVHCRTLQPSAKQAGKQIQFGNGIRRTRACVHVAGSRLRTHPIMFQLSCTAPRDAGRVGACMCAPHPPEVPRTWRSAVFLGSANVYVTNLRVKQLTRILEFYVAKC